MTGCVIAYCLSKRFSCRADFNVEFYDQFAKGVPIIPIVFGLGGTDLFLMLCLFFEITAIAVLLCGFWGKYGRLLKKKHKLYKAKQEAKRKEKEKAKTKKVIAKSRGKSRKHKSKKNPLAAAEP